MYRAIQAWNNAWYPSGRIRRRANLRQNFVDFEDRQQAWRGMRACCTEGDFSEHKSSRQNSDYLERIAQNYREVFNERAASCYKLGCISCSANICRARGICVNGEVWAFKVSFMLYYTGKFCFFSTQDAIQVLSYRRVLNIEQCLINAWVDCYVYVCVWVCVLALVWVFILALEWMEFRKLSMMYLYV